MHLFTRLSAAIFALAFSSPAAQTGFTLETQYHGG